MKKIELSENFYQYQFPHSEGQHFGFNIYCLINGQEALIIDTAYVKQTEIINKDLQEQGISITQVVFSHFHPDHVSGLPALNSPKLFGNERYQKTLDKFTPKEEHVYFEGLTPLTDASTLTFGTFDLKFRLIQGHVDCGMFTIINDQFVHVADDLMASNTGEPLLPYVHIQNAKKHINSLQSLKLFRNYTLLLSHGNPIVGASNILQAIDDRLDYLHAIEPSPTPLSIEEVIKKCRCDFLHKEWHEYVYL